MDLESCSIETKSSILICDYILFFVLSQLSLWVSLHIKKSEKNGIFTSLQVYSLGNLNNPSPSALPRGTIKGVILKSLSRVVVRGTHGLLAGLL